MCIYLNVKGKDRQRHLGLVTTLNHATSAAEQLLLEIGFHLMISGSSTRAAGTSDETSRLTSPLIGSLEQGATGSRIQEEASMQKVFTASYIPSLIYTSCHKHIASLAAYCTDPQAPATALCCQQSG